MKRTVGNPFAGSAAAGRTGVSRRAVTQAGVLVLLLGTREIALGASILAVRVWPAPEYTRVTIESDNKLLTKQFYVTSPPRLAVDIEGIDLSADLRELVAKVRSDDPFIAGIRVGQYAPGVTRLVIDLKQSALPQVFTLSPVAAYQHRLLLDLYPAKEADPLEELIAERFKDVQRNQPAVAVGPRVPANNAPPADALEELIAQQSRDKLPPAPAAPAPAPPGKAPPPTVASASPPAPPPPRQPPPQAPVPPPVVARAPSPPATSARTDRLIIVALDPGHGGEDPGAIGPGGTREKDIVLRVAHALRERINATSVNGNPMRAFMTRDADFFVPLHQRVDKARRVQADLFISIHADAFITPAARGASVFALSNSGASSSAARWLANKENKADLVGGLNVGAKDAQVQRAMLDMSTTAQINDSLRLGSALLREIGDLGRLHKKQVEQAGFAVLKAPDIPSVLIETAFISNPEEEARLRTSEYQLALADAIMRGILGYFSKNPPLARSRTL